jgi:hypothetical protein
VGVTTPEIEAALDGLRRMQETALDEIGRAPPERRAELIGRALALVAQAHCTFAATLPLLVLSAADPAA